MVSAGVNNWHLCLYISGDEEKTSNTARLLKQICEEKIAGKCEVEVIDIAANPKIALEENIIATPCLIKKHPLPEKRIIGNLNDKAKLIKGLGIEENSTFPDNGPSKDQA